MDEAADGLALGKELFEQAHCLKKVEAVRLLRKLSAHGRCV